MTIATDARWVSGRHMEVFGSMARFISQSPFRSVRIRHLIACMLGFAATTLVAMRAGQAQEANWIWTSEHPKTGVPIGDCYFRKTIQLNNVEQAQITIGADDAYELWVNGRRIGSGQSVRQLDSYDITPVLVRGKNSIAVRVKNLKGNTAAFAARVQVRVADNPWRSYSTDKTWRAALEVPRNWQAANFNDSRWAAAVEFGPLGETAPWDRKEEVATTDRHEGERFRAPPGFAVERLLDDKQAGSLIAMAFNEFGHLIASKEGGPLLLIFDSDKDGDHDKVRTYCEDVTNVQGILPLNGDVYVTGDGPEGYALYRLSDADRNGTLEKIVKLVSFQGTSGEHGAHGLALGQDGMIYVVVGNHQALQGEYAPSSTYKNFYEGDLVQPRMEDPGGHARGVKAPGGVILRTDLEGNKIELIAGGLRNAYDLAFHPDGTLFVHDSDMESDIGAAWHRPTQLFHVVEGSEFGWRSGWANWPEYYLDRLPAITETGRGSPTGAIVYDHYGFPSRYHKNLFLADWSEGRILAAKLTPSGSTYQAQYEVFVQGQPLNVTDLDVGPDGALYFCTGGRGTTGGIYRVRWQGDIPDQLKDLGDGITRAIRHPQINSAWARQEIATIKKDLGESWNELVAGVAYSPDNPAKYRARALDLMQLFGPTPTTDLLIDLSRSPNEMVRVKGAQMLGLRDDEASTKRLTEMLRDTNPTVVRNAAEGLLRKGAAPSLDQVQPLLNSDDRYLTTMARRLLENGDANRWADTLLASDRIQDRNVASIALMTSAPSKENAQRILTSAQKTLQGFVSDKDFIDLLRVVEVALGRGGIGAKDEPELKKALAGEFPAGESLINRELIRILTFLQAEEVIPVALTYINSDADSADRILVSLLLRQIPHEWSAAERFELLKFYELAQKFDSGSSVPLYVMNASREFGKTMSVEEARIFIAEGDQWPNAALSGLPQLPAKLDVKDRTALTELDQKIDREGFDGEQFKRLKTGIVAMLARSGDADSMAYLREIWRRSPDRRPTVALALASQPTGDNWDYLVRSLSALEPAEASEIMQLLASVDVATEDPDAIRQVILHGLRLEQSEMDPKPAIALLSHWIGEEHAAADGASSRLSGWQEWFANRYPDRPEAALPKDDEQWRWSLEQINEYLDSDQGKKGVLASGRQAFEVAQCAACHRVGSTGGTIGPDLTTLSRRFSRKETLEAILYPSHVISDQYASKRVLTRDGDTVIGIVSQNGDGSLTVKKSDRSEVIIPEEDVEEISSSKISLMPSGLLETLSLEQIRDMMAYLGAIPNTNEVASRPKTEPSR